MVTHYARWVIKYRYLVILLSILFIALIASGGDKLGFQNDYRQFFGETNPQLQAFENLQDTYTKTDNLLFMLEPKDGQVFSNQALQAVIDLTEASWQLPYSIRVDSISNFQYSYAEADDLTVEDLVPEAGDLSEQTLQRLRSIAVNEPLLVKRLISPSAHVTGVNVTIHLPGVDPNEVTEVVGPARELKAKIEAEHPEINVYLTGVVMMNNAFAQASKTDIKNLLPFALIAIIIGLLIFYRSITATLMTVVVIFTSIFCAMGSAGWLGLTLSPPSASAPTLILTLAVADCVHVLISYLHNMHSGMNKNDSLIESLRINFHPVFLTSLTTAIGFLSLNFSDAPPFQTLGNITAMGVIYAFIISVTLLPAAMSLLPSKATVRSEKEFALMNKLAEFTIGNRKALLWTMTALVVIAGTFITKNELNDQFVEYFERSVEFRRDTDHITENLTGMYFIDYSLGNSETSVSNPEFLAKVQRFVDWYKTQPETMYVNTYTDIMKRLNRNMHGDDPNHYDLPKDGELAAQYLLLYEMSLPYGLDLNNQINIDKSSTRVSVFIKTLTTTELLALEKRASNWLKENMPELHTQGASPSIMFAHIGKRNINSMLIGTTLALVLISLILIVALKSWKYGLLSLIPNLTPAFVGFGLWGLFVGQVGLAISIVVGMTLGIVVDDTVHFLSKYLRARRENNFNAEDAVRYAFSTVGVALVVTTIVLMAGFAVLTQSTFKVNSDLGLLTAITIAIALIIDFLLLPSLLIKLEERKGAKI